MRDPTGKDSQRFELLGLSELILDPLLFGYVPKDEDTRR